MADPAQKRYDEDKRPACKYGRVCFRVNSKHHKEFKHPPNQRRNKPEPQYHPTKRQKVEDTPVLSPSSIEFVYNTESESDTSQYCSETQDALLGDCSKKTTIQVTTVSDTAEVETVSDKELIKEHKTIKPQPQYNPTKRLKLATPDSLNTKVENTPVLSPSSIEFVYNTESESDTSQYCSETQDALLGECSKQTTTQVTTVSDTAEVETVSDKELIKEYFLVDMPDEFYKLWELCQILNPANPLYAFDIVDLVLVGPFDVLAGKFSNVQKKSYEYLLHWRYYYDPPEMQTVLSVKNKDGFHYGYYRDDPKEMPSFVCSGTLNDGHLQIVAANLFGAITTHISRFQQKASIFDQKKLILFKRKFVEFAKKANIPIATQTTKNLTRRNGKVVAKLFSGIGLVVHVDPKTKVGYRKLTESADTIKKILKNIVEATTPEERSDFFSKLQPIIQWANIAADECDFGTNLELGLDLFAYGGNVFHALILNLLTSSYSLLKRQEFALIIKAHLKERKKGNDLSILCK